MQDDLKWEAQTKEMVKRATSTTWALRRMKALGVREASLVEYWKSEGRVHLEQNCPIWSSILSSAQSQDLSRAQRVAMAAITGRWESSHTIQLQQLGLEHLGPRREAICKRFAHRTATSSRHQDLFQPITTTMRKGKQVKEYKEIKARTATYYKLALPYLTRLLNK